MSGGSQGDGGDWRPGPGSQTGGSGGGDGGGPADPCDIHEITNLSSPNPTVVRTLTAGAVLQVHLNSGPPRVVEVRDASGSVAGSITSAVLPRLVQCMLQGRSYEAEVRAVRGGIVSVAVRPA